MAHTFHKEYDNQRQLLVTVEISEDETKQKLQETARKLGKEMRFPGFRPGKVPYHIIVRRIGEDSLRAETLEGMLDGLFQEVLKEVTDPPYLPAEIGKVEVHPLKVQFVIPLTPQVTLGDYRALRRDLQTIEVSEPEITQALEEIRERQQIVETVERPAQIGDMVTISGKGHLINEDGSDGELIFDEKDTELILEAERFLFGEPFVNEIAGISAGESKEFQITLPETSNAPHLSNKTANFSLNVTTVQRRELPVIDDSLAQQAGEYETLEDLRQEIRKQLTEIGTQNSRNERFEQMLKELRLSSTLLYPPAAIPHEITHMIEEQKERVKRTGEEWAAYLRKNNTTEEQLQSQLHEAAQQRLETNLLLREFILGEKLAVKDKEIKKQAKKHLKELDPRVRSYFRNYWTQGEGRDQLYSEVMMNKVQDRIEEIFTGTAPDLALLADLSEETTDEEE